MKNKDDKSSTGKSIIREDVRLSSAEHELA